MKSVNKYNSEQRKMIADFLESEILPFASKTNRTEPFSTNEWWINKEEITNVIKYLRHLRFEDIKNKNGIKFRILERYDIYDRNTEFRIWSSEENFIASFIVGENGLSTPINEISDDTLVEIIKKIGGNDDN